MQTATTADEYRATYARRDFVTLPSGAVFEVRRIDIDGALLKQQLRAGQFSEVFNTVQRWSRDGTDVDRAAYVLEHAAAFADVIDDLVRTSTVAPRVVATRDEPGVWIEVLDLVDKLAIINKATELAQPTASAAPIQAGKPTAPTVETVEDLTTA